MPNELEISLYVYTFPFNFSAHWLLAVALLDFTQIINSAKNYQFLRLQTESSQTSANFDKLLNIKQL